MNDAGSTGSGAFFTVQNLKTCKSVFAQYMKDRYGLSVYARASGKDIRRLIYDMMIAVHERVDSRGKPLNRLNDMVIVLCRDVLLRHHAAPSSLDRDRQVYGSRPPPSPSRIPDRPVAVADDDIADSPSSKPKARATAASSASFDRLLSERGLKGEGDVTQQKRAAAEQEFRSRLASMDATDDGPISEADSLRRMQQLMAARQAATAAIEATTSGGGDGGPPPPTATSISEEDDDDEQDEHGAVAVENARTSYPAAAARTGGLRPTLSVVPNGNAATEMGGQKQMLIDDANITRRTYVKNLALNAFDRDWSRHPHRYRFTISTQNGGMHTTFRDVTSIQATCMVLPKDVSCSSTAISNARPDVSLMHSFGLPYPYVILAIDGFEGALDGTNDSIRRAFCTFVYNKQYTTPNGRGYFILEPMQDEIKRFEPQPLSSLRNLAISIERPDGALFNDSRDDYEVTNVQRDPMNDRVLRVILDKYFDCNEFYKGDTVVFSAVRFPNPPADDAFTLSLLEEFMARREGHPVADLDQPNSGGFRNSLYIPSPSRVDQKVGQLVVNSAMLASLEQHNSAGGATTGRVMNMSLQSVLALKVNMLRADVTPHLSNAPVADQRPPFSE